MVNLTAPLGKVRILRQGKAVWSRPKFATGEKTCRTRWRTSSNHHFKYAAHCRPGDAHIHFFGAAFRRYIVWAEWRISRWR